ncbi:MAG: MFS transporter [Gammaproteobacteria bacterium]
MKIASENTKDKFFFNFLRLQPWLVCLSGALFFSYVFMQMNLLNVMSQQLMQSFNLSPVELGDFSAIYLLGIAISFIPAGILLDRFRIRLILLAAMGIEIIAVMLFALAPNITVAIFARFFCGIVHSIAFLGCMRLINQWLPEYLGFAIGLAITVGMLGGIVAQVPMMWLVNNVGWHVAIVLVALLGCVIEIILWLVVRDKVVGTNVLKHLSIFNALHQVVVNRQNCFCAFYAGLLNLPVLLLTALWGNAFLIQQSKLTALQASFVMSMVYVGLIIGSPIVGWLSDKVKQRKLIMISGALLSVLIVLPLVFTKVQTFYWLVLLFLLLGIASSSQNLSYALVTELNPPCLTGTALAWVSIIIMGSGMLLQPLFGWVVQQNWHVFFYQKLFDNFHIGFLLLPIGFMISAILAYSIHETYKTYET